MPGKNPQNPHHNWHIGPSKSPTYCLRTCSKSKCKERSDQKLFEDLLEVKMQRAKWPQTVWGLTRSYNAMQNLFEVDAETESLANDHVPAAAESDVQLTLWDKIFQDIFCFKIFQQYFKICFQSIRQCQLQLSPMSSSHWGEYFNSWHSFNLAFISFQQSPKNYHATFSRHFNVQEILFNPSRPKWEDLQDMCHFEILPGESLKRLLHQIGH